MRTEALCRAVLFAVLWAAATAAPAAAQVPDNRGLKLDPEDSVPPAYGNTLEERDRERLDDARREGNTFIPVLHGPGADERPGLAENDGLRAPASPQPPQPSYEAYRQPDRPSRQERDGAGRGADFVGVLIESWTRAPEIVRVRYPAAAARDARHAEDRAVASGRGAEPQAAGAILPRIGAGRGLYARTLYAVDSDYPGPVLVELLEPPLAGAVASGGFTRAGERLVLRLDRLEYRGRSVPVDAWAAGLDCACYGVGGEVDSHWFERVLLPSAVRFAEGFLAALARPAESVSIGDGSVRYERREAAGRDAVHAGLATAARTAGDVLLENAPDGPTVRIPRDTELVVVFAAPPGASGRPGNGGDG